MSEQGIKVHVSVRLDLEEVALRLKPDQIAALFAGISAVITAQDVGPAEHPKGSHE